MNYITLCSGIGAPELAAAELGWRCVAQAEVSPFARAVLAHYYPGVPNLGDVEKITEAQVRALGPVDAVVFGFPCQDLSVAGEKKGLKNADGTTTRSGLFYKCASVADWSGARFALAENVPGLLSVNEGRDFAEVVGELAGDKFDVPAGGWRNSGFALGPKGLVEWAVLDAQHFGVPQRRRRVFIVRDSGDWAGRPPLLLDPESLRGHHPPGREAGQGVAGTLAARSEGGGGLGTQFELTGGLLETAKCLKGNSGGIDREDMHTIIPIAEVGKRQSGTPREGCGHGEPGDPMFTLQAGAQHAVALDLPFTFQPRVSRNGRGMPDTVAPTLGGADAGDTSDSRPCVVHTLRGEGFDASEDGTGRGIPVVPVCPTLRAGGNETGGDRPPGTDVDTADSLLPVVMASGQSAADIGTDKSTTLTCLNEAPIGFIPGRDSLAVRRLTPRECERLQGFPDDFTLVSYRGKPAADGPRYKALGNSMAVPCVGWVLRRLHLVHKNSFRTKI